MKRTVRIQSSAAVTGHTLSPAEEARVIVTAAEADDMRRLEPALRRASANAIELARPQLRALGLEHAIEEART